MAATHGKFAVTATAFAGTWATLAAAQGRTTGDYATWTNATGLSTATIELSGFGLQALVPNGATITSVKVTLRHGTQSNVNVSTVTSRTYSGATAKGPGNVTIQKTNNVISEESYTVTSSLHTWAELADLRVRIVYTRGANTTSTTCWVDRVLVEVGYTYAGWSTTTGTFRLWPATDGPAASAGTDGYMLGTQFVCSSAAKYLLGIRFWRPPDLLITTALIQGALFDVASAAEVAGTRIDFGDLLGSGWQERWLQTPVAITPGSQYRVACYFPDNCVVQAAAWGTTDVTSGPLTAGAPPNGVFLGAAGGVVYPASDSGDQNYWVDAIVGDLPTTRPGGFLPFF